jgi:hypothetical protein
VNTVDSRRASPVAPSETALVGHRRGEVTARGLGMIRRTGEVEAVGVGFTAARPVHRVVDLAMVAGFKAIRPGAATIACIAHHALVHRRDALAATQIQRTIGMILEHGRILPLAIRIRSRMGNRLFPPVRAGAGIGMLESCAARTAWSNSASVVRAMTATGTPRWTPSCPDEIACRSASLSPSWQRCADVRVSRSAAVGGDVSGRWRPGRIAAVTVSR